MSGCQECVKMVSRARYCLKCKVRSFCSESCPNADTHECFNMGNAKVNQIKISALTRLIPESKEFQNIYKTVNKQSRVRRRGNQKHIFRLIVSDSDRVCDIIKNPKFDYILASTLNEIVKSVDTLPLDWNNIMCMIMYTDGDITFIQLI